MQGMLYKDVTLYDEILRILNRALLHHLTDSMSCFSMWVMSCLLHFVQKAELEKFSV
jgi:hypothetical protein